MATTLPRIQAYVSEELHEKFTRWRRKKGFEGDSKALSQLLTEFFRKPKAPNITGGSSEHSATIESPGLEAKITEIVEAQISDLQSLIDSTVDCRLRQVGNRLPSVVEVQARIDEVVDQRLHDRIHRLEQTLRKRQEPDRDLEALVGSKIESLKTELGDKLPTLTDLRNELEARFPSVVAQVEAKIDILTDQVFDLEAQLKGEKSLSNSLAIKVMSLQAKIDGIKLSLPSSELPGDCPGELLYNSPGQSPPNEDLASKESDKLPSELLSELPSELPSEPPPNEDLVFTQSALDSSFKVGDIIEYKGRKLRIHHFGRTTASCYEDWVTTPDPLGNPVRVPIAELSNLPSELAANHSSLTGAELAKRLDVNRSTLPRKRDKSDFASWSQARDPQAIAWEYDAKEKVYRSKKSETERTGTSKLKSLAILHKGGS